MFTQETSLQLSKHSGLKNKPFLSPNCSLNHDGLAFEG